MKIVYIAVILSVLLASTMAWNRNDEEKEDFKAFLESQLGKPCEYENYSVLAMVFNYI